MRAVYKKTDEEKIPVIQHEVGEKKVKKDGCKLMAICDCCTMGMGIGYLAGLPCNYKGRKVCEACLEKIIRGDYVKHKCGEWVDVGEPKCENCGRWL